MHWLAACGHTSVLTKLIATCLVVVKEAKVWEKEAPSVTVKYFVTTSRVSPSPPFVVWPVVVV